MKPSKLITKKQRQEQYGIYIALNLKGVRFEQFLIRTIKLKTN